MKRTVVVVIVLGLMAILFYAYFDIIFTPEHGVDRQLRRQYSINVGHEFRSLFTHDHSEWIYNSVTGAGEGFEEDIINFHFERILPSANHRDILYIFNRINGSDYQRLPDNRKLLNDFVIYKTGVTNFHGINLSTPVYNSFGENLGMPAMTDVISFYSRENKRNLVLRYILITCVHSQMHHVLPVCIGKEEFIVIYDSVVLNFLYLRSAMG